MKKISKLLGLLPKAIKNAPQIVEGIVNDIKLKHDKLSDEETFEIAKRRLICSQCPFNVKDECSLCGCDIDFKTASLSSECGAASYNKENPDDLKEVKWSKYEKE